MARKIGLIIVLLIVFGAGMTTGALIQTPTARGDCNHFVKVTSCNQEQSDDYTKQYTRFTITSDTYSIISARISEKTNTKVTVEIVTPAP